MTYAGPRRAWLLLLLAAACNRVSPESIAAWKTAPEGPDRLTAALKNGGVDPNLRGVAAAALVEAGYPERMESALAGLPLDERGAVISALVPPLGKVAGGGDVARAGDAVEALYAVRELSTTDAAKKSIDATLFPALAQDLRAGREKAGRYAVKEILIGLRKDSLPTLQALLDNPAAPFEVAVEVLDKVGDPAARAQGGAALVKRARAASPVPDALWAAMATLGGKAVTDYLSERVTGDGGEKAAEAMAKLRRPTELLPLALRLAKAPATTPAVREQMFVVVEHVGGDDARKGLIEIVGATEDNPLRARAFRAALTVARGAAILPLLEAVPRTATYKPEELSADLVAPISAMPGLDSREGLFKALQSQKTIARLVAMLALEKMGFGSDGPHIAKLIDDKSLVRGFPRGWTLGREAARVVGALKKSKI